MGTFLLIAKWIICPDLLISLRHGLNETNALIYPISTQKGPTRIN